MINFIRPAVYAALHLPVSRPLAGETFSENYSHTEGCSPCTLCTGLMRMETPCTDSNDAVCVCDYNYFLDSVSGRCEPCTVCPAGRGVYLHCEYDRDTVCEECLDNTYSDRESSLDPCLPCTICDEETETELAKCTPSSDSVCHSKSSGRGRVRSPVGLKSCCHDNTDQGPSKGGPGSGNL